MINHEFWKDKRLKNIKRPTLALSGGADSALLLYLLGLQDVEKIYPYFLHRTNKPNFLEPPLQIINFMKELVGSKINDLEIIDITGREQDVFYTNFEACNFMQKKYNCDLFLTGSTANPPADVINMLGLTHIYRVAERDNEREVIGVNHDRLYYRPFSNTNKKDLANLYKELNLDNTLFPLTLSCTQTTTTKHCKSKDCWWCQERYWAFNRYE